MPSEDEAETAPATEPGRDTTPSDRDTTPADAPRVSVPQARANASASLSALERPSHGDTLLSAPLPADALELNQERLAETERRLDDLEGRLGQLERLAAPARAGVLRNWLGWVVFLLALAVAWLLWRSTGA